MHTVAVPRHLKSRPYHNLVVSFLAFLLVVTPLCGHSAPPCPSSQNCTQAPLPASFPHSSVYSNTSTIDTLPHTQAHILAPTPPQPSPTDTHVTAIEQTRYIPESVLSQVLQHTGTSADARRSFALVSRSFRTLAQLAGRGVFAQLDDRQVTNVQQYHTVFIRNSSAALASVRSAALSHNAFHQLFFSNGLNPPHLEHLIIYNVPVDSSQHGGAPLLQEHQRLASVVTTASSILVFDELGFSSTLYILARRDNTTSPDTVVAQLAAFFSSVRNTTTINDPISYLRAPGSSRLPREARFGNVTPLLFAIRKRWSATALALIAAAPALALKLAGSTRTRQMTVHDSPLHAALTRGMLNVAHQLVTAGVPPTQFINGRDIPAVCFLEHRSPANPEEKRVLKALVTALVEHGDQVHLPCPEFHSTYLAIKLRLDMTMWYNALYCAAANDCAYLAELLVTVAGLPVNGPPHALLSPLSVALAHAHSDTVDVLLRLGADLN